MVALQGELASANQKHFPIQIRVATRHQYGISAVVLQTSFREKTSGSDVFSVYREPQLIAANTFTGILSRGGPRDVPEFLAASKHGGAGRLIGFDTVIFLYKRILFCILNRALHLSVNFDSKLGNI